jgi:beta-lactamase regulating signal transducer with metallopeptidase domain/tetratricopeptide (TPR) repeat protein
MNSIMNFAFNAFWQTALISIAGFFLLKIFRRWSAPKRSLLALNTFVMLAVLPVLTALFISLDIGWLKYKNLSVSRSNNFPAIKAVPSAGQKKRMKNTLPADSFIVPSPYSSENPEPEERVKKRTISGQTISRALFVITCIWGVGIAFMLGQLLYGLIFLRGFRFGLSRVSDDKISNAMKLASTIFNARKLPEVYMSSKVESPITIGLFKPIMILPENLYASLNENEIKSIILHEFSHIFHCDHLLGLLKRIITAANWWNPLVYIISAEHSNAREEVSDNYVLSQLSPKIYSECLAGLAEKTCLISSLPATVGMADKHISLETRVKNILSTKRKKEMKTGKNIKGLIGIAACFSAVFIGGVQYTFADDSVDGKESKSSVADIMPLTIKGSKLSSEEAGKLEKKVSKNPDELDAVAELLGYYYTRQFKDREILKKRNKIILWLIEHHPASAVLENPVCQLIPFRDNSKPMVSLWKTQAAKHPKNLKILWNAAFGLFLIDRNLAEKYLKKGQSLDSENPKWSEKLGLLYSLPGSSNKKGAMREYKKAYKETKTKNTNAMLPRLAKAALSSGEFEEAEKYAHEMLEQSKEIGKKNWNYGNLIYYGNFTLGRIALKEGKIDDAEKYLLEAGKTSGSPQLNSFGPNMTLAKSLLEKGRKECVVTFLESCSKFWNKDKCAAWIKQIKSGETPDFRSNLYQ